MAAYRRVYDSRHRLTAKNRDQLRKPTLEYGLPVRVRVRCEGSEDCDGDFRRGGSVRGGDKCRALTWRIDGVYLSSQHYHEHASS